MERKHIDYINKGMRRDLSISKTGTEYAYENFNIRITPHDYDTLLSVTSEKTEAISTTLLGSCIGQAVLNDYLVLFLTNTQPSGIQSDAIVRLNWYRGSSGDLRFGSTTLFTGNLNFSLEHPIETISYYESEDIQKVYWTDGYNQPRMINIASDETVYASKDIYTKFDFVTTFESGLRYKVTKEDLGNALFPSGVIQYFFTYYNKYGQETNIVAHTSLYYLSNGNKGAAPDSTAGCSFRIVLSDFDRSFDYIRIYSLIRTSYNTVPQLNIVNELAIHDVEEGESLSVIDTGNYSVSLDPTILQYIGGRGIVAGTFTHKDNTLFLGNISLIDKVNDTEIEKWLSNMRGTSEMALEFRRDPEHVIPYYPNNSLYSYASQLNYSSSQIKIFKTNNLYRIGCRFIKNTGAATQIYYLGDIVNKKYPKIDEENQVIEKSYVNFKLNDTYTEDNYSELKSYLEENHYSAIQLFMAEASDSDRLVACQGILCPVMFQLNERIGNSPYAISSWCFRPEHGDKAYAFYDPVTGYLDSVQKNITEDNRLVSTSGIITVPEYDSNKYSLPAGVEFQHIGFTSSVYQNNDINIEDSYHAAYFLRCHKGKGGQNIKFEGYLYLGDEQKDSFEGVPFEKFETKSRSNHSKAIEEIFDSFAQRGVILPGDYSGVLSTFANNTEDGSVSIMVDTFGEGGIKEQDWFTDEDHPIHMLLQNNYGGERGKKLQLYGSHYYVDNSIVTMHSPEVTDDSTNNIDGLKLRIVGVVPITSVLSDYYLDVTQDYNGERNLVNLNFSSNDDPSGLTNAPLLQATTTDNGGIVAYWLFPWHKANSVSMAKNPSTGEYYSEIKKKIWSNLYYSYNTCYFEDDPGNEAVVDIVSPRKTISGSSTYAMNLDSSVYTYQSDYETVVPIGDASKYPLINSSGADAYNINTTDTMRATAEYNNGSLFSSPVEISFKSSSHLVLPIAHKRNGRELNIVGLPTVSSVSKERQDGYLNQGELPVWSTDTQVLEDRYLAVESNDKIQLSSSTLQNQFSGEYGNISGIPYEGKYTYNSRNYWYTYIKEDRSGHPAWNKMVTTANGVEFCLFPGSQNQPMIGKIYKIDSVEDVYLDTSTRICYIYKSTNEESGNISLTVRLKLRGTNKSNLYTLVKVYDGSKEIFSPSYTDGIFNSSGLTFSTGYFSPSGDGIHIEISQVPYGSEDAPGTTSTYTYNCINRWIISTQSVEPGEGETNKIYLNGSRRVDEFFNKISRGYRYYAFFQYDSKTYQLYDLEYDRVYNFQGSLPGGLTDTTDTVVDFKFTREIIPPACIAEEYQHYVNGNDQTPFLLLGEMFREANGSEYGGNSEYALQSNRFLPISEIIDLDTFWKDGIQGTEGDAFFQRWDCVKTYPFSDGKQNNCVEMLSCMVETYTNVEGRYDSLRGMSDNTTITPDRINQINPVYSQPDNYITGVVMGESGERDSFPAQITWTKTKTPTESVDVWTNITLAGIEEMDGDKGSVNALKRFQNSIIAFQDKGIAEVLFNSRTQLATQQGVPIEIANSGKVDGKRYVTDKEGCINKWSIVETRDGIYFIDDLNSSISVFNGQVQSLSDMKGFKNWISHEVSDKIWNLKDYGNFATFWDKTNDDIYFTKAGTCLNYNEMINEFTSFFSYSNVAAMVNIGNAFIAVHNVNDTLGMGLKYAVIGEVGGGKTYNGFIENNLFPTAHPSSVEYRVTPEPYGDKIFTNIDYRADVFDINGRSVTDEYNPGTLTDKTFTELRIYDEYQDHTIDLTNERIRPSDVKSKFRLWNLQLPRAALGKDNPHGLNRIRNPWMHFKLTFNPHPGTGVIDYNDYLVFHNFGVTYYQ